MFDTAQHESQLPGPARHSPSPDVHGDPGKQLGAGSHDPVPEQSVSHAHELSHSMPPVQLRSPEQVTSQRPESH